MNYSNAWDRMKIYLQNEIKKCKTERKKPNACDADIRRGLFAAEKEYAFQSTLGKMVSIETDQLHE
jgi:hypothetical protein